MRERRRVTGATLSVRADYRRAVSIWLGALCAMIVAMVVVGGITRLTGSGLSIVEWRPVTGALPPLHEADWQEAFAAYQRSPQYRLVNAGMSLEAFKAIFFWEYVHRLLGRVIGVVFLLPWLVFVAKRVLSRALSMRLAFGFVLGGLQGALGWFMVASGLVDEPRVSHLRLAAHLSLALFVLAYLLWTLLDVRRGQGRRPAKRPVRAMLGALAVLTATQIVYGAFTAGLHAGIGYNTFPKMLGVWFPAEALAFAPAWRNLVMNPVMVQLAHRTLGETLALAALALPLLVRREPIAVQRACFVVAVAVALQLALGIATLLLVVPIGLAVVHQLGACLVWMAVVVANHTAR